MRYEIMGPLRVVDANGTASLRAQRLATVLAVLLIRAGHVVTVDQLMTEIWGEAPPQRADASIHVCISRLRKFLRRPGAPANPIVSSRGGYQLVRAGSDEYDFDAFQDLVARSRTSTRAGRYAEAVAALEQALGLWRGPVLGDGAAGPIVESFAKRIAQLRMECIDTLVEAKLELGCYQELVGWLHDLTEQFPLREGFHWQLMSALYHSGRTTEALRTYDSACRIFDEELGLGPGPKLRELRRTVLASSA